MPNQYSSTKRCHATLIPSAPLIHSRTYGTPHSCSKFIASPEVSPIHSRTYGTPHSGSKFTASPEVSPIHSRTYGTSHSGSKFIASPEVSPIGSVQQNKSITSLSFSERMILMDNSPSFRPSVSPLGTVPIQHEDDCCPSQTYTHFLLPSSSSVVITLETSSPVKGETESLNSTSVMITSETSTPVFQLLKIFP